jgi:hypothetical protein
MVQMLATCWLGCAGYRVFHHQHVTRLVAAALLCSQPGDSTSSSMCARFEKDVNIPPPENTT